MINKVILVGNIGGDIEVKHMNNGNAVANLTLATNETWKDKTSGERKTKTEWHRVVLFGKVAEVAGQYLKKGSTIYIEGKLQTREWEKDGVKRYTTEVVVDMGGTMKMLDSRGDREGSGDSAGSQRPQYDSGSESDGREEEAQSEIKSEATDNNFDDDIPF